MSKVFSIRDLSSIHALDVLALYQAVAVSGTLGRDPDEYDHAGVSLTLSEAAQDGVCLGAFENEALCAEVHAARLKPKRFRHVFSGLTMAVRPSSQGQGIGSTLFAEFIRRVDRASPIILRTELILQAGNKPALALYKRFGFEDEGRLRERVQLIGGKISDDILMARLRPTSAAELRS